SNRARFFRHFGPDDGRFERRELEAAFATPIGSEVDFDLGVDYVAMEGADTEGTVGWQAVTTRAGAYWTHGDVELEGIYAHERFQQDGPEFGGSEDSFAVLLAPARNHRYMFEGSAWWRSDDFEGLSPALNKWTDRGGALSLTADVLDGLLFYGRLYTQHISNSVTQNSFARNRKLASGALTWSRWDWLTLEAGGEFFETDYVSRFQDITDEPRTAVFWTKVRARPCDDLKVSASYVNRDVDAVPPSTLTERTTALPVIWDQVKRLQANATYSIGDRAAVSYDFAEDKWRVAPQNANTRLTTNTGTAWWSPSGDWTFYANYINMDWAASGPGAPGVRPGDFATDIDVVSAGASYRLSQKSVANVNYTHVSGFGAVGTDEDVWDASYSHDLTDKTHVTVRYRFDQFDEDSASPSKDYRVHLFGVELGHDF
ncbi:MAG: porin, partial [Armatimonadota bacterium]